MPAEEYKYTDPDLWPVLFGTWPRGMHSVYAHYLHPILAMNTLFLSLQFCHISENLLFSWNMPCSRHLVRSNSPLLVYLVIQTAVLNFLSSENVTKFLQFCLLLWRNSHCILIAHKMTYDEKRQVNIKQQFSSTPEKHFKILLRKFSYM